MFGKDGKKQSNNVPEGKIAKVHIVFERADANAQAEKVSIIRILTSNQQYLYSPQEPQAFKRYSDAIGDWVPLSPINHKKLAAFLTAAIGQATEVVVKPPSLAVPQSYKGQDKQHVLPRLLNALGIPYPPEKSPRRNRRAIMYPPHGWAVFFLWSTSFLPAIKRPKNRT